VNVLLSVVNVLLDTKSSAAELLCSKTPPGALIVATGQTVVYKEIISVVTDPNKAGQLVIVGAQLVIVYTEVAYTVEVVDAGGGGGGAYGTEVAASLTGQTVVYSAMVSVVTDPNKAGQLVIVGAQLVIV